MLPDSSGFDVNGALLVAKAIRQGERQDASPPEKVSPVVALCHSERQTDRLLTGVGPMVGEHCEHD